MLQEDSICQTVNETTPAWLKQFFGTDVEVTIGVGPKQEEVSDCGLYAIATCVSLSNNRVPGIYIQRTT